MCLALYIASDHPLPVVQQREIPKDAIHSPTWPSEAQRFYTAILTPEEEVVRSHFSHTYVLYAGSYEGCSCGFNFGREYPEHETDEDDLTAARESVAELVRYVRESKVQEIYSCWFDDEARTTVHQHTITPETLAAPGFIFEKQELLKIDHGERH